MPVLLKGCMRSCHGQPLRRGWIDTYERSTPALRNTQNSGTKLTCFCALYFSAGTGSPAWSLVDFIQQLMSRQSLTASWPGAPQSGSAVGLGRATHFGADRGIRLRSTYLGSSKLTWCSAGRAGGGKGSQAQCRVAGKLPRYSSSYTGQLMRLRNWRPFGL